MATCCNLHNAETPCGLEDRCCDQCPSCASDIAFLLESVENRSDTRGERLLATEVRRLQGKLRRLEAEIRYWESGPRANRDTMTRAVAALRVREVLAGPHA